MCMFCGNFRIGFLRASESLKTHVFISQEILACQNAEEILKLCDAKLPEFNEINAATLQTKDIIFFADHAE